MDYWIGGLLATGFNECTGPLTASRWNVARQQMQFICMPPTLSEPEK